MIATSGDEAFVMLALFPGKALLLFSALAVLGTLTGITTDLVLSRPAADQACDSLEVHPDAERCRCFDPATVLQQLRQPSATRGLLLATSVLFALALTAGAIGPPDWGWVRSTLLVVALFALFVVATVPEHFLEQHLWRHVVLKHIPRVFSWTFVAMLAIALLDHWTALDGLIRDRTELFLLSAAVLGIVPESGPHLLFVTLFDRGVLPMSILVTSSIVQDGHGMLPLLAHSWRDFLKVKAINVAAGLAVGALLAFLGR
jgi:hypothetical protein